MLTKKAQNLAQELGHDFGEIEEFVKESLEHPSEAIFWDDELYDTHTLVFHTPAWEVTHEDILDQANYRTALKELEPYGATAATVKHWTYSRFECIKVPVRTRKGKITPGAVVLFDLMQSIEDYPVLDESLYSELEWEVWEETVNLYINEYVRDWDDKRKESVREILNESYGPGYWEPEYIDENVFMDIVETVKSLPEDRLFIAQRHQETTLF